TSSRALVETILERIERAAFVVDREGRIAHTNRHGITALEDTHTAEAVRAAGRTHTSPRYDVVAVSTPGVPSMSLIVDRECGEHTCAVSRFGLTKRQADVAGVLCMGASNREIGEQLQISERTVEVHLSAIYERLGVEQRAAAIACLLQGGSR
ncbi:MAG TPA: LuxR C-terminal-related transcriptional regulator, partial [Kofleriaceae bacterium]|nr:LuxR C-terminal-related transcriptional regulator [Kofleriaceae bacterium]